MQTFAIADCPTRLPLAIAEKGGKPVQTGAISLTVRNASDRGVSGRIQLRPQGDAKPSWFAIAGASATGPLEIEQDFAGKGTRTITVTVTVDAGATAGNYLFNVRVTSETDPDNDYVDGPAVAFEVLKTGLKPVPPRPFPWWAVAVGAGMIVIVCGIIGYFAFSPQLPTEEELVGMTSENAEAALRKGGFNGDINKHWGAKPDHIDLKEVTRAKYAPDHTLIDLFLAGIKLPGQSNMPLMDLKRQLKEAQFRPIVKDDRPPEGDIDDVHPQWRVLSTVPELGGFGEPQGEVLITVGFEIPEYEKETFKTTREDLAKYGTQWEIFDNVQDRLSLNLDEDTWIVTKTEPQSGTIIPYGATVLLHLGTWLPDVTGEAWTVERATAQLRQLHLEPEPSGECADSWTVSTQKPSPDDGVTTLDLGQSVELTCTPPPAPPGSPPIVICRECLEVPSTSNRLQHLCANGAC